MQFRSTPSDVNRSRESSERHRNVGDVILDAGIAPKQFMRGSVLVPGLPLLPPNVERYPVPGGGTRTITLDAGDQLTVIDREGRQPCELVVFDGSGRSDPALIGASGTGAPLGTQEIFGSRSRCARDPRL